MNTIPMDPTAELKKVVLGAMSTAPLFIGTKVVRAFPMTREDYITYRGWVLPTDENGSDEGYLVEYQDSAKTNVEGHLGYVSWTPKKPFDDAYRTVDTTFGMAIEAMKRGYRVARAGWNGKGMWVAMTKGHPNLPADQFWNPHSRMHAEANGGTATVLPTAIMKTATGEILMGWLASQSDMFAEDWAIVG